MDGRLYLRRRLRGQWLPVVLTALILPALRATCRAESASTESVTLALVGDILLAHRAVEYLEREGVDYPYRGVARELKEADLAFGNLESPVAVSGGTPARNKEYVFLTHPAHAKGLAAAGFRVVSVANNHTLDFGVEAFRETLEHLRRWAIVPAGGGEDVRAARQPAIVQARGRRIAFLAYNQTLPWDFHAGPEKPGTAYADPRTLAADIGAARRASDWVIVSFHWGSEYDERAHRGQLSLARAAVRAGADAVVGHHPHIFQGVERRSGKIVAYSLGNFSFGTRNPKARHGLLLKLRLAPGRAPAAELVPLVTDNDRVHFQPRPAAGEEARRVLAKLEKLSAALGTRLRIDGDRAFLP